jgi:hypothetical protein
MKKEIFFFEKFLHNSFIYSTFAPDFGFLSQNTSIFD